LPAHLELTPAWRDVSAELRRAVGDSTFDIWFSRLKPKAWDGAVLVLDAPPDTRNWLAGRFGRVLERCARSVLGADTRVAFAGEAAQKARAALGAAAPNIGPLERFIPRYTFDQFIIGDGNRLAHAAALTVAEDPGQAHNPLFLHARPGLGKTHLLHAIGNYITAFAPDTTVRYTTAEAFTNGFIAALAGRDLDRFKHLYRDVDVLLIDDVQFLASKAKTEEEFFHTFNAVRDTGRQLVLTCDRLPRHLPGIAQRLRDRFESGLVTEIASPDRATRLAVLRKRAALDRVTVPDQSVLDLIADRVTDNIRALEGALIRVVAHHSLTGRPIDPALARTVLDEIHPVEGATGAELTVERIQEVVASHFEITVAELVSQRREARIAWPRQVAIHLARALTDAPLQELGRGFGGRNHATILHACKRNLAGTNRQRWRPHLLTHWSVAIRKRNSRSLRSKSQFSTASFAL
jgi:chromosomal replication initiator protein